MTKSYLILLLSILFKFQAAHDLGSLMFPSFLHCTDCPARNRSSRSMHNVRHLLQ